MDTIADRSKPSNFGILFIHQQAFWQALAGGGAEATNVGRIAVAVCIVTSTIMAFLDAESPRAGFVPRRVRCGRFARDAFNSGNLRFTETRCLPSPLFVPGAGCLYHFVIIRYDYSQLHRTRTQPHSATRRRARRTHGCDGGAAAAIARTLFYLPSNGLMLRDKEVSNSGWQP